MGFSSHRHYPEFKVFLKEISTNNGKTAEYPNYRSNFYDTLSTNGHQYVIGKNFNFPDDICWLIKYYKYSTDNYLVFSILDLELVISIVHDIVYKHRLVKDGRGIFLDIDSYQKVQGSEEICETNAKDKIYALNIITQFPEGS